MSTPPSPELPSASAEDRIEACEPLIQKHTAAAVAIGFLPLPLLDMAALVAVQLNLIRALGEHYGHELSDDLGRSLIASLVGGIATVSSASLLKAIPVIGTVIGGLSAPVLAGASTWALGRVFLLHFESGGTFLTLDPDKVRAHYEDEFVKGQSLMREHAFRKIRP